MGRINELINKILKDPSGNIFIQLMRYGISGFTAFSVDFIIFFVLDRYTLLPYLVSNTISFSLSLIVSYLLNSLWVFDKRKLDSRTHEFAGFALISLVGLGLSSLQMWIFIDKWQLDSLFAKVITNIVVTIWNFTAKKVFLYSEK